MDKTADVTREACADAPAQASTDLHALIASLRAGGAHRFDPVRLRYIEALARRSAMHRGGVKNVLDAKLAHALAAIAARLEEARAAARQTMDRTVTRYPQAADELQQLFVTGEFRRLERRASILRHRGESTSLAGLVHRFEEDAPDADRKPVPEKPGMCNERTELKTIRDFRSTWSRLSADNQVKRALELAPSNAGPINSHSLMLRSLALMRDLAPDYLHRFMSHADTLLCLEQCDQEKPGNVKKPPAAKRVKNQR
jgi:hypothetical protein